MMVFQSALQFFRPYPVFAILLISFLITLLVTLVYKWTTKQSEIKKLKKESKDLQTQLKTLSKTDPKKAMALQKKAMEKQFQLMKHSLKPSLYTLIPVLFIFSWLNASMAFYEIPPGKEFTITGEFDKYLVGNASISSVPSLEFTSSLDQTIVDGKAVWKAQGAEGSYSVTIQEGNHEFTKTFIISSLWDYSQPLQTYKGTSLKKITIGNEPVSPFGQSFSLFGWHPGWLSTYIISSVLFSFLLRKLLDVA